MTSVLRERRRHREQGSFAVSGIAKEEAGVQPDEARAPMSGERIQEWAGFETCPLRGAQRATHVNGPSRHVTPLQRPSKAMRHRRRV